MKSDLTRAIKWLYRHGRPIDVARYEYLFLEGSKDTVINALKSYQNTDGGFGHGFEPDSQNPFSTPVQTWMTFEVIDELGLEPNHELVESITEYLLNKAPKKDGFYLATIPSNNSYPHASWWTYSPEGCVWGYNPTMAIAGFLYEYSGENKIALLEAKKIIQQGINDFIKDPSNNMHEIRCFMEMVDRVKDLGEFANSEEFLGLLLKQIDINLEKNTDIWFKAYCVRPLQFFDKPGGFGFEKFKELAYLEASMILNQVNKDGIWDITWDWDDYPIAKEIAKRDWQSSLILGYLKILKAYEII